MQEIQDITKRINFVLSGKIPEFCDKTKIPRSTVESWTKGAMPNAYYIMVLCEACNCSADWLLSGKTPDTEDVPEINETPAEYQTPNSLEKRITIIEENVRKIMDLLFNRGE